MAEVMHIIGDVKGQNCLIVDDLIDTAGTLVKAPKRCSSRAPRSVRPCATHAVLSGPAVERIEKSAITEVVVTNSIPFAEAAESATASSRFRSRRCSPRRSSRSTRRLGQYSVYLNSRGTATHDRYGHRADPASALNGLAGPQRESDMRQDITVAAELRRRAGRMKRAVRAAGTIPAVVYGAYKDPWPSRSTPRKSPASCAARPAQHHLPPGGEGRRKYPGHDRRLAERSGQGHAAARRHEAHRPDPAASVSRFPCIARATRKASRSRAGCSK